MNIRPFMAEDQSAVIALWDECGLTRPWNSPELDIARKSTEDAELFLVGTIDGVIVASVMAGYDGHRGSIHYLAVAPTQQRQSLGRAILTEAERLLAARGCPKINLLLRSTNSSVLEFYERLGYERNDAISLGRRLIVDSDDS